MYTAKLFSSMRLASVLTVIVDTEFTFFPFAPARYLSFAPLFKFPRSFSLLQVCVMKSSLGVGS